VSRRSHDGGQRRQRVRDQGGQHKGTDSASRNQGVLLNHVKAVLSVLGQVSELRGHRCVAKTGRGQGVVDCRETMLALPSVAEAADGGDSLMPGDVRFIGHEWARVPDGVFVAWNAVRLTELAGHTVDTHIPDGRFVDVVLDGFVPVFAYPIQRCRVYRGRPLWMCSPFQWTRDWLAHLDEIVDAVERNCHVDADVSTRVVVGDRQVPAATWETESTLREGGHPVPFNPRTGAASLRQGASVCRGAKPLAVVRDAFQLRSRSVCARSRSGSGLATGLPPATTGTLIEGLADLIAPVVLVIETLDRAAQLRRSGVPADRRVRGGAEWTCYADSAGGRGCSVATCRVER
jgi:hypothetical protein